MVANQDLHNQIADLISCIDPVLKDLGLEVVDLEMQKGPRGIFRVFIDFIDSKDRKVGIEECVQANHILSPWLDESGLGEKLFQGAYDLEVSSPGVERPLRREKDFYRFQGEQILVKLAKPLETQVNYQKKFQGTLLSVDSGNFELEVGGKRVVIPFPFLLKAQLIVDWRQFK